MKSLDLICLKLMRWSSWPLLLLLGAFFFTGYAISGRYGLATIMDEKSALTLHKLLHLPLIILTLVHSVPAVYLALIRWGWIKR